MHSILRNAVLPAALALSIVAPDISYAGVATPVPSQLETGISMQGVEFVSSRHSYRPKPGCRATHCYSGHNWAKYRKWQRQKYFGRIVAGVALGTIIATAANATPRRPSSNLCWYWANSARTRGYWDYCF